MFVYYIYILSDIGCSKLGGITEDVYKDFLTEAYTHADGTPVNQDAAQEIVR